MGGHVFRVPVDEGEAGCPFELGGTYVVGLPIGRHRVRVTAPPERQRLALVTLAEARRELGRNVGRGVARYRSQSDWRAEWVRRHDRGWCRRHPQASDGDLAQRFARRWLDAEAWVVEFALVDGPPRLLASQLAILTGQTGAGEYVGSRHKSIDPEVEAVDEDTLTRMVAAKVERAAAERLSAGERRRARRRARLDRFGREP